MLDMGFRDEMEELLEKLPDKLQTLFFSATMNKNVERLIKKFGNEPEQISVVSKTKTVDTIDQSYAASDTALDKAASSVVAPT